MKKRMLKKDNANDNAKKIATLLLSKPLTKQELMKRLKLNNLETNKALRILKRSAMVSSITKTDKHIIFLSRGG